MAVTLQLCQSKYSLTAAVTDTEVSMPYEASESLHRLLMLDMDGVPYITE